MTVPETIILILSALTVPGALLCLRFGLARARLTLGMFVLASLIFASFGQPILIKHLDYFNDVLITIGINILLAVSLNLVNGYTGQFSLCHAAFMAVGAYTAASWSNHLDPLILRVLGGPQNFIAIHAVLFISVSLGGLLAACFGLVVGIPSLRLKGDYLAIVTLGFGLIIQTIIQKTDFLGAQRGLSVTAGNYTDFFWTYSVAALAVYVVLTLVNSTYGRAFLTVRDDEIAAESLGINTTRTKVFAFVIGALFAGFAGALSCHYKPFITPYGFDFFRSVDVVVMVILGGMGSTAGVVLAAILLTILPEFLRALAHSDFLSTSQSWMEGLINGTLHLGWQLPRLQGLLENRLILYSLLLIVMMLTRPQGIFGDFSGSRRKVRAPAPQL